MKKILLIIGMMLMGLPVYAGTTQISPVSNGNQTVVVNDNFDSLQGGLNSLQGLYNTFSGYFSNGILTQAAGGTGVNSNTFTVDGVIYQDSTGFASTSSGISGQFLKSNGPGATPTWWTVSVLWGGSTTFSPVYGSWLYQSEDAEVTSNSTNYTKVREMVVASTGTYTVSFDIKTYNGSTYTYGRIYVNGVTVGTERSTTSSSYAGPYTENFTLNSGDLLQLYTKTNNGNYSAYSDNFRVYIYNPYVIVWTKNL